MVAVKRLGILGGMSWASSLKYYEMINLEVLRLTGGAHAADLVLWSFDFTVVEPLIEKGDWITIGRLLQDASRRLLSCEVQGIIIASNTIHRAVEQELWRLPVPFIHIRDSLIDELGRQNIRKVGFVGTSATMKGDVYRNLVDTSGGIEVVLPPESVWSEVDDTIFNGLCRGLHRPQDDKLMRGLLKGFADRGVNCVVLGCTELGLLGVDAPGMTLLDTTAIHALDAAKWSVGVASARITANA